MHTELVSIIVPVYNVENYLEKCIQSICSQTYKNLEIILSDDGSTDQSGKICDKYACMDSRIKVIHKKNGGLSDARNAGIAIATGRYYMFVDSDDFIAPDTAENLYSAAITHHCEIAVCNMVRIFEDGTTEPFYNPTDKLIVLDNEQRFETLNQPSVCNKLFLADLFKGIRFPKGKFYEDTFVYHELAYKAKIIVLTGYNGYYYLSRKDSILGKPRYTDRYFDFIEAVHNRFEFLQNHGITHYAEQAGLSLYAAVANGEKNIPETEQNKNRFLQIRRWYKDAYGYLMKSSRIGSKQKVRLFLLRYFPDIHSRIF